METSYSWVKLKRNQVPIQVSLFRKVEKQSNLTPRIMSTNTLPFDYYKPITLNNTKGCTDKIFKHEVGSNIIPYHLPFFFSFFLFSGMNFELFENQF